MRTVTEQQQDGSAAAIAQSYERLAARGSSPERDPEDDEDEVVERDLEGKAAEKACFIPSKQCLSTHTSAIYRRQCAYAAAIPLFFTHSFFPPFIIGRFSRYKQIVGSGRFKTVYRGFDERRGVDVAWSKVGSDENHFSPEQMKRIVDEMSTGTSLDHPHVIKSYDVWADPDSGCINMVTEYFTSGNLREYRHRHKALDVKAVKKWGRQILQGLAYLHQREPPVVHGDLRPDKIYINGHSGEIKIGDLGLSVLVPKRFAPGVMPEGDPMDQYTCAVDIFAFGLVMLELVTLKRMDRFNTSWQSVVEGIPDPAAREFISKCLAPEDERPTAIDLLKDPFLQPPKRDGASGSAGGGTGGASAPGGAPASGVGVAGEEQRRKSGEESGTGADVASSGGAGGTIPRRSTEDQQRAECEAGSVRGEDYLFQFSGKIKEGKLHFRLQMQYEGDGPEEGVESAGTSKTIDFVYDPEVDTPDEIAAEISSEFNLSPTDRDICAAALKEWLADQGPDPQR